MADDARDPAGQGASISQFLLVGGASVLGARVVGMGAGTASHMLLARLLLPEQLAAYFLTLSVVEVGTHLVHLGLPKPLTRFVAQARGSGRPDEARGAVVSALPLWLAASAVVALVYAGGFGGWLARSAFHSEVMASGAAVASAWLIFQSSGELFAAILSGFRRVGVAAWLVGTLARVVMVVVLLSWYVVSGRAEFVTVLWLAAGAALLGLLAALAALRRELVGPRSARISQGVLLRSALPLLVTGLVYMAYDRADLWTVGVLFEPSQVAVYGAVKRLIVLISLPLFVLNLVVPPIVAELYAQRDVERLQRALRGAATLVGIPAIAAVAVFVLASEDVLGLAFGPSFREGGLVLTLLSLERLVFVWAGPTGMVLAMTGHERTLMFITLVSGVVTVGAVLLGAHFFGLVGIAAAYAASSGGQQLVTWIAVLRATSLRTDIDLRNLRSALDALQRALRPERR